MSEPLGRKDLDTFLKSEGMDLLIYFKKKDVAVVTNYRGDILFRMKTDVKKLIREIQKRSKE